MKILTVALISLLDKLHIKRHCCTAHMLLGSIYLGGQGPRWGSSGSTSVATLLRSIGILSSLSSKARYHLSKKQLFSDSTHNSTSVPKPYSLRLSQGCSGNKIQWGTLLWFLCKSMSWIQFIPQQDFSCKRPQVPTPHLLRINLCLFWLGHLQWCERVICRPCH